jgi:hypothetical protein
MIVMTIAADKLLRMALKVVHITKQETIIRDAEARALWEDVLKPKWQEQARHRAEALFAKAYPGFNFRFDDPHHA